MRIECSNCGASGNFDESRLPAGGANVTCPRCKEKIWVSSEAAPQMPAAASPAAAVSPTASSSPAAPSSDRRAACVMCRRPSPVSEMVQIQGKWVCGDCKPDYVRTLKMGLTQPGEHRYAGFWIRLAAKIIDGMAVGFASLIILLPLQFAFMASTQMQGPGEVMVYSAFSNLLQFGITAAYGTFFLGKFQATPGKMACGLRVVRPAGENLTYLRSFGRCLAEVISYIIIAIGYIIAAFDSEKRTLHDRICDTRVVYK